MNKPSFEEDDVDKQKDVLTPVYSYITDLNRLGGIACKIS